MASLMDRLYTQWLEETIIYRSAIVKKEHQAPLQVPKILNPVKVAGFFECPIRAFGFLFKHAHVIIQKQIIHFSGGKKFNDLQVSSLVSRIEAGGYRREVHKTPLVHPILLSCGLHSDYMALNRDWVGSYCLMRGDKTAHFR